jgi:GNAT superfamily N-acetyltransferase
MSEQSSRIWRLREDQCEQAGGVLARAFHDYPLMVHSLPEPVERMRQLLLEQTWNVRHGRMFGHVLGIGDPLRGVAIAYPPGDDHFSDDKKRQSGHADLAAALGPVASGSADVQTLSVFDYGEEELLRAVPEPHWWLEAIAVDPAAQNRGLGGQLLDALHALTDATHQPLILLTHEERAVPFYLRHGYDLVCEGTEPTSGVRHWGMRRYADGEGV